MSSPPTLPSVSAAAAKGKEIAYIAGNLSFPFTQNVLSGVKAGAKVLGMRVAVTDSQGDPSTALALIDRAVSEGANAIIVQGIDPGAVSAGLAQAKAAKVPVISVAAINAGAVSPTLKAAGLSANASFNYADVGKRLADYVAANSGGKANVGLITSSSFPASATVETTFKSELTHVCSGCTVTTSDSPVAQWQTQLGPLASSMLISHPNIDYMIPMFDAMNLYVKPALAASAAGQKVKLASQNASLADMQSVAKPTDPENADIGSPEAWLGWAVDDQVVRLLAHAAPAADEQLPNRTFTKANIASIPITKPEADWYGSVDFVSYYTKLWTGK